MSVTFSLKVNNAHVRIPNSDFNKDEPDDPIYNPQYEYEPIYPEINVSNINAHMLIIELGLEINQDLIGTLLNKDIEAFLIKLRKLQSKFESLDKLSLITEHEVYLKRQIRNFDKLSRYAIALNDDIVWS